MNSVENTNMSNISMEELIAIGEYFSGNIPSDDEQFETDVEKFFLSVTLIGGESKITTTGKIIN